jgi:hypothetical protein
VLTGFLGYNGDITNRRRETIMAEVWVAFDHVIHYKVDLDNKEIVEVEIPGWINTFDSPGTVWNDDGVQVLTEAQEWDMLDTLESEPMPDPTWG